MQRRPINYPLWIGGLISALILALAIFGPRLAPHDPMAEVPQFFFEGKLYTTPPFGRAMPPFTHPDYPLGLDDINRDVLSRLLWAVRPTLLLCAIVVIVRVALGVVLGLLAGWFSGMAARIVDALSSLSASVPLLALVVALVLGFGIGGGLGSFVVALSIVGWIDAAAIVRNRAITVQSAPYIESARALGIGTAGILWRHVLPQLWPVLPVVMVFELSAVLLLIAELGYLGYFVGGGYVYETRISDFGPPLRLIRAGYPELGQMLSGFFRQLYHTPWVSICAGTLVFLALTGFTLLGEGLRRAMDVTRPRSVAWWQRLMRRLTGASADDADDRRALSGGWVIAGMTALLLVGLLALAWGARPAAVASSPGPATVLRRGLQSTPAPVTPTGPPVVSTTPAPEAELATIDLEPLLFESGDLPAAYSAGQVTRGVNRLFRDAPVPVNVMNVSLRREDIQAAVTSVLLYPDKTTRDEVFDLGVSRRARVAQSLAPPGHADEVPTPRSLPPELGIGERSAVFESSGFSNRETAEVGFTRCGAIVWIHVYGGEHGEPMADFATHYARRLESRLAPVVCE